MSTSHIVLGALMLAGPLYLFVSHYWPSLIDDREGLQQWALGVMLIGEGGIGLTMLDADSPALSILKLAAALAAIRLGVYMIELAWPVSVRGRAT